ncbi:v-type proton ATPase subunit D, partial [Haematococcus lacustris]
MSGNQNRLIVAPTVTAAPRWRDKGARSAQEEGGCTDYALQGNIMKDSFFSYTNAVYAAGEGIKHTVLDNVETASVRVAGGLDNVAGVKIPKFRTYVVPGDSKMDLTGLGRGGQQLQNCRKAYLQAVEVLATLANLQTAFYTLDAALK